MTQLGHSLPIQDDQEIQESNMIEKQNEEISFHEWTEKNRVS